VLERPGAAPDPRHEPLPRQLPEIAADGHLGNSKRLRKFRNLNVITRLEQAQHMLHPLRLREVPQVDCAVDGATL
jgi:hypothetical protein